LRGFLKSQRGSVVVLVAAGMVMLMGCAALVTDIGMMTIEKSRLQNAVDAAALAGAQELPDSTLNADSTARDYVNVKNVYGGEVESINFDEEDKKITVVANNEVNYIFARVLGMEKGDIQVKAAAQVVPAKVINSGLRPFGVDEDVELVVGEDTVLKFGAQDSQQGNRGALDFKEKHEELQDEYGIPNNIISSGANFYYHMIEHGSYVPYEVGEQVLSEPGNMGNKTKENIEKIEGAISIIPIIRYVSGEPNGSSVVEIVRFAAFYINKVEEIGQGNNGHIEITGRFMHYVTPGIGDENIIDTGVYTVKLVE
jgi:hypothetical protein